MVYCCKNTHLYRKRKENRSLFALISQVHTYEDKDGADNEVNGDLLGEQPPSKQDRGDGIEVDTVGSHNSPQRLMTQFHAT